MYFNIVYVDSLYPTLIPDLPCCLRRTFSGFISQWIILFLYSVSKHCSKLWANFLTSCSENPWNLFFFINSYRLIDKSSKVMQVWLLKKKFVTVGTDRRWNLVSYLKVKLSSMWMMLQLLSLSCFLRCSSILISSWACLWNLFSFLTIFRATCWWVLWS